MSRKTVTRMRRWRHCRAAQLWQPLPHCSHWCPDRQAQLQLQCCLRLLGCLTSASQWLALPFLFQIQKIRATKRRMAMMGISTISKLNELEEVAGSQTPEGSSKISTCTGFLSVDCKVFALRSTTFALSFARFFAELSSDITKISLRTF